LRERQVQDLAKLDEEENLRIKQLLRGQRGGRFFRGSPIVRGRPGNRAGTGAAGSQSSPGAGAAGLFGGAVGGGGGRNSANAVAEY
jgi:hypothetical protein